MSSTGPPPGLAPYLILLRFKAAVMRSLQYATSSAVIGKSFWHASKILQNNLIRQNLPPLWTLLLVPEKVLEVPGP
jgi:hypothetical protein